MIVKRRVLDPLSDARTSPFLTALIDPSQVIPVWETHRGLKAVYRCYSAKVTDLVETYGDFAPSARKQLENEYGKLDDDTEITQVVEYWDRWWRCVTAAGRIILPVTAHEYGEVPYTIGYGPLGEPNLTWLPDDYGSVTTVSETWRDNLPYKSVSYIRFRKESHALHEAIMRRAVYGVKKELYPAVIRERSMLARTKPAPELDSTPNAQNEVLMGEERIQPFPTSNPLALQAVLGMLSTDRLTGSMPLQSYGVNDRSNVSGTAIGHLNEAGMDKVAPWVHSLETFLARDYSKAIRLWRNFGHTIEFGDAERRPMMVPVSKPYRNEASSFELKKEVIDKVGPDVQVKMTQNRPSDWVPMAQAAKLLNELGVPFEYMATEWFNLPDYQRMREEWDEERTMLAASQHPQFLELVKIPAMFAENIKEAEGDPEQQQVLAMYMQAWMQFVAMQSLQQQQQQQQGPPGMGGPQGPGGPPPEGMNPPTSAGVSMGEMGQGPGSTQGMQGGPPGPVGPRSDIPGQDVPATRV
jgi:hypothetical protein